MAKKYFCLDCGKKMNKSITKRCPTCRKKAEKTKIKKINASELERYVY